MKEKTNNPEKKGIAVVPPRYQDQFIYLLDSLGNFYIDVRKILFALPEGERRLFLDELAKWIACDTQEVYYFNKFIHPRRNEPVHLNWLEYECAVIEDHISLHVENYGDYVEPQEFPATDIWIKRKRKEIRDFFKNDLRQLRQNLNRLQEEKEWQGYEVETQEKYQIPEKLIDWEFGETGLIDATFRIKTQKNYHELHSFFSLELDRLRKIMDEENYKAFIHNIFQFPGNPYPLAQVLQLSTTGKKQRGLMKEALFYLYDKIAQSRSLDKEITGKILFSNFSEDRKLYFEENRSFQRHVELLSSNVKRKKPSDN